MASIAINPVYLKDVVFTVAADGYEKHVSSVTFTPSTSTAQWKGLTPSAVFTNTSAATWVCDLEYAQDWTTTNSLSKYLFNNQGNTIAVTFQPTNGEGDVFEADVIVVSGAIGGAVDGYATTTVSLPVQGAPTVAV